MREWNEECFVMRHLYISTWYVQEFTAVSGFINVLMVNQFTTSARHLDGI